MTRHHRIALILVVALDVTLAGILMRHRQDIADFDRDLAGFVASHLWEVANG